MHITTLRQLILATSIACASAGAFAQDAMKPAPMSKADTAMQDCKDRVTTSKGEKRNDTPVNAETDKACADMAKHPHGKQMKHGADAKKPMGTTQEAPTK